MKNIKGFTLVEVVVTVIIVGILAIAGTAVYRRHLDNAKYAEGMTLLQSIKEQQDIALTFSSDTAKNPFRFSNGLVTSTFKFDRNAQNLGIFCVYPQNYTYFKSFEIRKPEQSEINEYKLEGFGYIVESYYPDKANFLLKLQLIGSSEGPYHIVKDRAN